MSDIIRNMWPFFTGVYNRILGLCKKLRRREIGQYDFTDFITKDAVNSDLFLHYTTVGDLEKLKMCKGYDRNSALKCAVENNQKEVVDYLIADGADNLDQCLSLACTKNYYDVAESLVKNGAKIVFGLRASKSPNILRMLYRYEQGSEVII
jgi:hypothetical protein